MRDIFTKAKMCDTISLAAGAVGSTIALQEEGFDFLHVIAMFSLWMHGSFLLLWLLHTAQNHDC